MGVLVLNSGQNSLHPAVCWMHKVSSYRPTATKTLCSACRVISQASQIWSDQRIHTVDRKWSDRMDGSSRTGRCGNHVGVSLYIPWRSFPKREMRAGELTESHLAVKMQSRRFVSARLSWILLSCFSADALPWLWIWRCCSLIQKALWNLIWATEASRLRHICRIWLESNFKPLLYVAWVWSAETIFHVVFLPSRLPKINLDEAWFHQKWIWTGSLNAAFLNIWEHPCFVQTCVWLLTNRDTVGACRMFYIIIPFQTSQRGAAHRIQPPSTTQP